MPPVATPQLHSFSFRRDFAAEAHFRLHNSLESPKGRLLASPSATALALCQLQLSRKRYAACRRRFSRPLPFIAHVFADALSRFFSFSAFFEIAFRHFELRRCRRYFRH